MEATVEVSRIYKLITDHMDKKINHNGGTQ